jgi:CubicO group peptidase (beta-lactamase class C family)
MMTRCHPSRQITNDGKSRYSDSLTNALDSFSRTSLIPGFSVSIVNDSGIVYTRGFGMADLRNREAFTSLTIHAVASVSKTFVALSIMKLVEQKKLSLDEPINSILPYKIVNPYFPGIPITVRHLVTHTSTIIDDAFVPYYIGEADICIIDDDAGYDSLPTYLLPNLEYMRMGKMITLDEHTRKYTLRGEKWYTDSTFLQKMPGEYFQYSNLGAAIAARIVEIRSGTSFEEFTRHHIFEPLGMKNTGWNIHNLNSDLLSKIYVQNDERSPNGVVEYPQYHMTNFPVSGLKTNAIDLGNYLVEMIKGYEGIGKLLDKASYQVLFQPQLNDAHLDLQDTRDFNDKFNVATLWSVSATGYRLHFGGNTGVYAFVYFNPETKSGALAFCNLRDGSFGEILSIVHRYEKRISGN